MRVIHDNETREIDISGTHDDWAEFAPQIASNSQPINLESDFDPFPYSSVATRVVICRNTSARLRICIRDGFDLVVEGNDRAISDFRSIVEDMAQSFTAGHHIHFDPISFEDQLAEDSASVVLTCRA